MQPTVINAVSALCWLAGVVGYVTLPDDLAVLSSYLGNWIAEISRDDVVLLLFAFGAVGFFVTIDHPALRVITTHVTGRFFVRRLNRKELADECSYLSRKMFDFIAARKANQPDLFAQLSNIQGGAITIKERDRIINSERAYHEQTVTMFSMQFSGRAHWLYEELEYRGLGNRDMEIAIRFPRTHSLEEIATYFSQQAERLRYHIGKKSPTGLFRFERTMTNKSDKTD